MKKVLGILACVLLVLTCFALTSCGKKAEEGTVTRIEMDINPSIEFMVDDKNKVIAVTALNDDGSILISNEVFIGLDYDAAITKAVTLAKTLGYLAETTVNNTVNDIKVSVSGATKYAENVKETVTSSISQFLEENNIKGSVTEIKSLTIEELRAEAVNTSMVTEEEAAGMNEKQLLQVIGASRIETAELLTKEMREAYYRAKEYKIEFAEKEEVANLMKDLTGVYATAYSLYAVALQAYSTALQALDQARYDYLVSPESQYQKTLVALREKKAEFIEDRNYTLSLDVNGEEYAAATLELKASEEEYDEMVNTLEQLGTTANEKLEQLISALKTAEQTLTDVYSRLPLPSDFEETVKSKAKETETQLNALKDSFFEEYEEAHKADFDAIEAQLKAQKEKMLENAKSSSGTL